MVRVAASRSVVVACDIPLHTAIDRRLVASAYFRDSYRAPLKRVETSVVEAFTAIFAHHPTWMKIILRGRNRIASWCGLEAPKPAEVMNFEIKSGYAIGEKIGVWPIYSLSDGELVVGRDNRHLDFRLSLLKEDRGGTASVVVSTICIVHNVFGKMYLFFIVPFHKRGVRLLISRAIAAGRL